MAFSLFTRKNHIVNIIINDHSIRYLEIRQAKPPIPYKWGEKLLPAGIINNGKIIDYETLTLILEECVSEWKIKGRQVRFLIPESFVIVRKVTIPAEVKDDEIKGHLYLELGTSIHLPFDEPVFDAVVLSEENDKKEILIFAAQEENVLEFADLFSELKLEPVEAEVSPLALYRLYYLLGQSEKNENLLSVQFDTHAVNISIIENGIPFFMHHIPLESDGEKWDMKLNQNDSLDLTKMGGESNLYSQFDDIYKEINRLMDFFRYSLHQGQKSITKILLNGDHPMFPKIKSDMEGRFEITIDTILYDQTDHIDSPLPNTYFLALGLALKGVK